MAEIPVTEFGARLKQARQARGISLAHIANVTKISVRALEAVERNDFSRLPGGIYTRSFVRAYAGEVGLDPEIALEQFLEQCPEDVASVPTGSPESIDGHRRPEWQEKLSWRHVIVALAVLAVVAIAAWMLVSSAGPAPAIPVEAPRAGAPVAPTRDAAPPAPRLATEAAASRPSLVADTR